MNARSANDTL